MIVAWLMSGSEVSWSQVLSGVDKLSHGRRFKVQLGEGVGACGFSLTLGGARGEAGIRGWLWSVNTGAVAQGSVQSSVHTAIC